LTEEDENLAVIEIGEAAKFGCGMGRLALLF
jgi:hypothetical protein